LTVADPPPIYFLIAFADNCGRFTIAPGGGEDLVDPEAGNDYQIHVQCLDINGDPILGIPATDIWLWHDALAPCGSTGSQADGPTDMNGYTTISGTIHGGLYEDAVSCDQTQLQVIVLGIPCNGGDPVCVAVDSPDLNGDREVGVPDFARFVADFNCMSQGLPCDPCHDYDETGDNDISDFAIFADYFNSSYCP